MSELRGPSWVGREARRLTGSMALDAQSRPLGGQHGAQHGCQALDTCHQDHGAADHLEGAAPQLSP